MFTSGIIFVRTGLAYKVFGTPTSSQYFSSSTNQVALINERFSALKEFIDIFCLLGYNLGAVPTLGGKVLLSIETIL